MTYSDLEMSSVLSLLYDPVEKSSSPLFYKIFLSPFCYVELYN